MSLPAPPDPTHSATAASAQTWGELERLLARWRAGDPAALDLLLARIHPALYRWALANATDVDDADDIAQQALVAVYRKIGQFRSESPLAVWLYRLTTRTAVQRRRTFARRKALDVRAHADVAGGVCETDPGGRVDRDRLTTLVRQCYDRLPPQQRAAFSLVDLEGYTPAEAAELMELAPVTLRASLFKARSSVRRQVFTLSPALAEEKLLTGSADEIRELRLADHQRTPLDAELREAAELCLQSHAALASSLGAELPRTLTAVVLARHRRRWKWRLLLCGVFIPLAVLALVLSGTAIAALVTAFLWP